jgi:hypothetical protein
MCDQAGQFAGMPRGCHTDGGNGRAAAAAHSSAYVTRGLAHNSAARTKQFARQFLFHKFFFGRPVAIMRLWRDVATYRQSIAPGRWHGLFHIKFGSSGRTRGGANSAPARTGPRTGGRQVLAEVGPKTQRFGLALIISRYWSRRRGFPALRLTCGCSRIDDVGECPTLTKSVSH